MRWIVNFILPSFPCDNTAAFQLKEFAQSHVKDTGRTIQQAIERAQANILWMDMNADTIVQWLSDVGYDPDDEM